MMKFNNKLIFMLLDLWNDALENIKPFDENTYNMITQFLDRLPGNICFVAHNGNRFDYPIFLSEIDKLQKVITICSLKIRNNKLI